MAARLTDKQKKKIIADYVELGSYNAVAKRNGVSDTTVKRIVQADTKMQKKVEHKKEENSKDIIAYMDTKKELVCEIITKGLEVLNDAEKLREATPSQITTALGTLIDKWAPRDRYGNSEHKNTEDDPITKSLKEEFKDGLL